jgi:hypothetical protein
MALVVDELEGVYDDQIEFRSLDANTDGKASFRAFNLRGHPAYVLLNPSGEVLWSGLGEQPMDNIKKAIEIALETP